MWANSVILALPVFPLPFAGGSEVAASLPGSLAAFCHIVTHAFIRGPARHCARENLQLSMHHFLSVRC